MEQTSHNGASPGPPKPSVTHPPPGPSPPFPGCSESGSCRGVSKPPGIPGPAPAGGKRHQLSARTLIREPTWPPSSPAGKEWLSARDLAKAMQRASATCREFFPAALPYSSRFMEETLQLQGVGGILRVRCPLPSGCPPLPQSLSTHPSHTPSHPAGGGGRQAYHRRERKLR